MMYAHAEAVLHKLGVQIHALTTDSRRAGPGVAFAAYPGSARDGRDFIPQAVAAGAPAVLWEREHFLWDPAWDTPNCAVDGLRGRVGEIAACVYGHPSAQLELIGVTGTNGKTSVSHWIAQALDQSGVPCTVVGTLGNGFVGQLAPAANTTPDAVHLQEMLASDLRSGARACAMEVSSHGLHQGRVNGCRFRTAVLTNLSRDHLDYHGSMEAYAEAKTALFNWPDLANAVLNLDDPFGQQLADSLKGPRVMGYGLEHGDIRGELLSVGGDGLELRVDSPWGSGLIHSPLLGRFNAYNLLAALGALLASGLSMHDACRALERIAPPAGRMQKLGGGAYPLVVIDYAHTPDALENVLATLRQVAGKGRLLCVFGCGGNRDKGKRPLMGRVAEQGADRVFVTSDNPRNEDPQAIIDDVLQGMQSPPAVEVDREQAIARAIQQAQAGDIVLVAGKGHEDYQDVHGEKRFFSDRDVAERALATWRA